MDVVEPKASPPPRASQVDDEASADSAELDLTPRSPVVHGRRPNGRSARKWPWIVVLVAIFCGVGFVVSRGLSDATLFFYNADEAVVKRSELGTRPFRVQGTVVRGTKQSTPTGATFVIDYNGIDVNVNHVGDPPELFQEGIPVVLNGHWASTQPDAVFASDLILVKHTSEYEAQNPDHLKQAEQGGQSGTSLPAVPAPPTINKP